MTIIVSTFYKFIPLSDLEKLRFELYRCCRNHHVYGTILIAPEGINATISGPERSIPEVKKFIHEIVEFSDIEFKDTYTKTYPFDRLKVKIKSEIIKLGPQLEINENSIGAYLDSQQWDTMLGREDTIVIDTRNDYEVDVGTFENAINPKTDNFTDLPQWLDENLKPEDHGKNILMFCTGGVRCEKSTAYLKQKGFDNVYHLKGGIIQYLLDKKNSQGAQQQNKWHGSCFVFDDRRAIDLKDYDCQS